MEDRNCSVAECSRAHYGRGMCQMHYRRWRNFGEADPRRTCAICSTDFRPYRTDQRACSRNCWGKLPEQRARARRYFAQEYVKEAKNAPRRVGNNPSRREVNTQMNLRKYGLTIEQYRAMIEAQGNMCAICERPPLDGGRGPASRLHVDHDHVSGVVRALLCQTCNTGIGSLGEDPSRLRKAADYLERHRL